jgi:hypothetical protein
LEVIGDGYTIIAYFSNMCGNGTVVTTPVGGAVAGASYSSTYMFSAGVGYSGISGYSGYSGISGYSGYSGPGGSAGSTGTSGYSGYSGISGYSGYSGISGYSGYSGSGISGYSGYSGATSTSGYSGYSGQSGYSGYSGSGISGYSGYSGGAGTSYPWKGAYGAGTAYSINDCVSYNGAGYVCIQAGTGQQPDTATTYWNLLTASGYSGKSGYSGYSGISGYSGYSGISGYSGYSGISGYSGFSGKSGYSGFSGYSGISGYSGYSGISGYSGFSGKSGYSGFSGASDIRLKRDIRPFTQGLEVVSKINPVWYKWNGLWIYSNDDVDNVSIIAQEIESIAPYTIEKVRGKLYPEGEETDILIFNGMPLIFVLVNAVKELKARVEDLEKRLNETSKRR